MIHAIHGNLRFAIARLQTQRRLIPTPPVASQIAVYRANFNIFPNYASRVINRNVVDSSRNERGKFSRFYRFFVFPTSHSRRFLKIRSFSNSRNSIIISGNRKLIYNRGDVRRKNAGKLYINSFQLYDVGTQAE